MASFMVRKRGTDTSGRPIFATDYMWSWLAAVKDDPNVKPFADKIIVTQGAFMAMVPGGGADASAGFHDKGGCIDFRLFNLTTAEAEAFVWAGRTRGGAIWRRDAAHGWTGDTHLHCTLGGDRPMSTGAASSWQQYVNGTNGLANFGRDLERRPNPLVLSFTPEDDMQDADFERIAKMLDSRIDPLAKRLNAFRENTAARDKAQNQLIRSMFAGLPAAVAEAVVSELPAEGSNLSAKQLRLAIRTGTTNAIRDVFGSLDDTEASP